MARFETQIDSQIRSRDGRTEFLRTRTRLFPDDVSAWWLLALLRSTKDPEEARRLARVAEARATQRLGDIEEARQQYRTIVERYADADRDLEEVIAARASLADAESSPAAPSSVRKALTD